MTQTPAGQRGIGSQRCRCHRSRSSPFFVLVHFSGGTSVLFGRTRSVPYRLGEHVDKSARLLDEGDGGATEHSQGQQTTDLGAKQHTEFGISKANILLDGLVIAVCARPENRLRISAIEITMLIKIQRDQELFLEIPLVLSQKAKEVQEAFVKGGMLGCLRHGFSDRLLGNLFGQLPEQGFFGGKVMVERSGRHVEGFSNLAHGQGPISPLCKQIKTLPHQVLAITLMVNDFRHTALRFLYRSCDINKFIISQLDFVHFSEEE